MPSLKLRFLAALIAALAVALVVVAANGASRPACFGAAARDPEHHCSNPSLKYRIIPSPADAELAPNAFCDPLSEPKRPFICAFGADAANATDTVALIGDSHATHWRAALAPVSQQEGWYGLSLTRTGCPLSDSTPLLPGKLRAACLAWRRQVFGYFAKHPEITKVFVSEHRVKIVQRRGMSLLDSEVKGYVAAWNKLPQTVRHIFVIRDTPYDKSKTASCVVHARNKHLEPGKTCAIPRGDSLHTDPAAIAAQRLDTPRVRLVDMTPFFCSPSWCYPVVGGALVHKDTGHITSEFGQTLAPYLQREIDRQIAANPR